MRAVGFALLLLLGVGSSTAAASCVDTDGDGVCDDVDNCVLLPNPNQGKQVKLNKPLAPNGTVWSFLLSPDGARVVYRAEVQADAILDLLSVPVRGGISTKLNGPLAPDSYVTDVAITSDSAWVLYLAPEDTPGVQELYRAPIDGGPSVKLSGPLLPGKDVVAFIAGPNNTNVVYMTGVPPGPYELFSVPFGGGASVKLNPTPVAGGGVWLFRISPDGSKVVHLANQDVPSQVEAYSVPIQGGASVKLNAPMASVDDVWDFVFSPNSSRVVYRRGHLLAWSDFQADLFSVPIGGGTAVKLNAPIQPESGVEDDYQVSLDGARVLYTAEQDVKFKPQLFSVTMGGGPVVQLDEPGPTGSDVQQRFILTPDGSDALFVSSQYGGPEVRRVPVAGGETPVAVSASADGDLTTWAPSPDASKIVYSAAKPVDISLKWQLFAAPISGGRSWPLSPAGFQNYLKAFAISPDGSSVVYLDQQGTDNPNLFGVSINGLDPVLLSGPFVPSNGAVKEFSISAVGPTAVYRADQQHDEVFEIYAAPLSAGGLDYDKDGYGGACDCAVSDRTVWQLSGEARSLLFLADKTTLQWIGPASPGGAAGSVVYDTLRSTSPSNFLAFGSCVESNDATDLQAHDAQVPALGATFYYLVRPENPCGWGSLGTDSSGNPRPPAVACGP